MTGGSPAPSGGQSLTPGEDDRIVETQESLRRLARALIASAVEAYELERLAEPVKAAPPPDAARTALYSRPRNRWGRAA